MATVLRVTDKRGRGVYAECVMSKAGLSGSPSSNRPMPWEDGLGDVPKSKLHRFGFQSAGALREWFARDIPHLADHTQVRIYEVKDNYINFGRKQLTFHSRHAKLVGIKNIMEI